MSNPGWSARAARLLAARGLPLQLALLAGALCLPGLWLGWQTDDYIHRAILTHVPQAGEYAHLPPTQLFAFIPRDPAATLRGVDAGYYPWWTDEHLKLHFFRPLAGLSHWLDYRLWPATPSLMHAQSLAWFAAAVALAAVFYRRMIDDRVVAGLAALLYAMDDAHGMPAVWLANRNSVMALFFGLAALLAHDAWRSGGSRDEFQRGAWFGRLAPAVAAPMLMLLSLLSAEAGLGAVAFLIAYAVCLDGESAGWTGLGGMSAGNRTGGRAGPGRRARLSARAASLLPCAAAVGGWWLYYRAMGYGSSESGVYIDPGASPARFAAAMLVRAPLLLWGQFSFPACDFYMLLAPRVAAIVLGAVCAFVALLACVLWPLLRRDAAARFFALGMVLSLVPSCGTFASDRLLIFTGLGGMGLLARFLAVVYRGEEWLPRSRAWRWPARGLFAWFVLAHFLFAPVSLATAAGRVAFFGRIFERSAASLPSDERAPEQTCLLVNAPTSFLASYAPMMQALAGRRIPARLLTLGSGIEPVDIRRPDERTLLIRPRDGYLAMPGGTWRNGSSHAVAVSFHYMLQVFDHLYRDDDRAFPVGWRRRLTGLTVTVEEVTPDGRPAAARFEFDRPLEDASLRFLKWSDGVYAPFELPPVGGGVALPAVTIPTE